MTTTQSIEAAQAMQSPQAAHPMSMQPMRPMAQGMTPAIQERLVYVGLAAIARAVGAGPHTIKRWIREEAFPARRCTDGIYRATAESMRDWFAPPYPGLAESHTSRQWAAARRQGSAPARESAGRLH